MENQTESSQSLTTRSGYLAKWETNSRKLTEAIGTPLTPKQLTDQMARLNATFGTPKDRTPEQLRMMAAEWFNALKSFGSKTVNEAFSKAVVGSKWWPALAEIVEDCRAIDHSWKDALGLSPEPAGRAAFSEGHRPTIGPDELAQRAAAVLRMKQEFGFNKPEHDLRIGEDSGTRASQEMTVSEALLNTCAARRNRGLRTCGPTCCKQNCELKAQA